MPYPAKRRRGGKPATGLSESEHLPPPVRIHSPIFAPPESVVYTRWVGTIEVRSEEGLSTGTVEMDNG